MAHEPDTSHHPEMHAWAEKARQLAVDNANLREREKRIRELCTTDNESKGAFIARVLSVLNAQ